MSSQAARTQEAEPRHFVRIYDRDEVIVGDICAWLRRGLTNGEPGIVIAEPLRRKRVLEAVPAFERERAAGRLVMLDARDTLEQFVVGGHPDPRLFQKVLGGLVEKLGAEARIWAYGEMVDLLWRSGKQSAALELEQLWGRVMERAPLMLLCGYRKDSLGVGASAANGTEQIRACHDHDLALAMPSRHSGSRGSGVR